MIRLSCCLALVILLAACNSEEKRAKEEPLLAAETFHWSEQALTFQPPPVEWRRGKYNQGGLLGVDFVHQKSVGERIYVAEYSKVGRRSKLEGQTRQYRLEDLLDEVRFSTVGWPVPPDSFEVSDAIPDTLAAGIPAYHLDFILHAPERTLIGREYYFMKKNHLFEAFYLGLPVNIALFERVVDTISFPDEEQRP